MTPTTTALPRHLRRARADLLSCSRAASGRGLDSVRLPRNNADGYRSRRACVCVRSVWHHGHGEDLPSSRGSAADVPPLVRH
uniref:Uncharacterized protein n=1 Tax=uncultured marine virus TaxID=186617 RepID=A0A0F7L6E2_9VIRU|nr:hypothetical protein [uncultured marine virus]